MASTRNRQRALARAKLERQMTRRAEAARRRRQIQATIGIIVAAVLVIGGATWLILANTGHDKKAKSKNSATSQSACKYTKAPADELSQNKDLKDVGVPKAADAPHNGTASMAIATNVGEIDVKLDPVKAPCNSYSFSYLAGKKFFDNSSCHRLTLASTGLSVLQCGDPSGTGKGGPTYTVNDENLPSAAAKPTYPAGTVAVANTGSANSGSSQFFIVYADTSLPAKYSVVGTVTKGLDLVQNVAKAGVTPADPSKPGDGAPKQAVKISTLRVSTTPASAG